jgi:hypothetical protein
LASTSWIIRMEMIVKRSKRRINIFGVGDSIFSNTEFGLK